jgi:ElaB/YqjD/DUF883 family membrane-anchored ribosome-binding protein
MDTTSNSTTTPTNVSNGAAGNPQKVVDRVAQSAHETVDRVAAAAGPAIERLRGSASTAAQTLQSKADQFGQMQDEWISTARNYVRENPFTALAIGVLAGLVIGRMGRSD